MKLENKVIKIIEENIEKKEKVTLNMDLRNELGLDSFAMIIIVNALEDEFGISIQEKEFRSINTVADIANGLRLHYPELKES